MMKSQVRIIAALAVMLALIGCVSAWRAQKTTADMAASAKSGWADYYVQQTNVAKADPARIDQLNQQKTVVDNACIKLGQSLKLSAALTEEYATNSAVKTPLNNALSVVSDNASNVVWLISQFTKKK